MGSTGQIILNIKGMSCEHCASRVKASLEAIRGVRAVEVLLKEGRAVIELDLSACQDIEAIKREAKEAVEGDNYSVISIE